LVCLVPARITCVGACVQLHAVSHTPWTRGAGEGERARAVAAAKRNSRETGAHTFWGLRPINWRPSERMGIVGAAKV